ncbi:cobalt-precorrin 6A reductase [Hydrogenispora ethanolica]|uniref:Cobalt-precorrin 6A reductase n=1 Tax=Hydrogenispora ethanolica TaxID=1082276 RepID=A0A4R1S4B7_HYDET|nr:precorrin-6A reductase [Hydrogenispora ethanolica]TCL74076.1 cobalt-precorrin 6A reductase [Hydrogenispora ethanolica]
MILVLGGTSEGREIARALQQAGRSCLLSVASGLGELFLEEGTPRRVGRLEPETLEALLRERHVELIIDATHPYAVQIQALSQKIAREQSVAYWRFQRPRTEIPDHPAIIRVPDYQEAFQVLRDSEGGVLFTIGVKNLGRFRGLWDGAARPVWAKVYPTAESMEICRACGLRPEQIYAFHGPGTPELLGAILKQTRAAWLVTKESGQAGGTDVKLAAALESACKVLLIDRPTLAEGSPAVTVESIEKLLGMVKGLELSHENSDRIVGTRQPESSGPFRV